MTRIPTENPIPESLTELFPAACNGRRPAPNVHRQMAAAPTVLAAYDGICGALERHGTLDRRSRFAVMLAVSGVQQCDYTQPVNTVQASRAGFSQDQTGAILAREATGEERLDALVAVAHEAGGDAGRVSESTWHAARDAGLTVAELAEAYASVALSVFVNQFVNYADTPSDVPVPAPEAA